MSQEEEKFPSLLQSEEDKRWQKLNELENEKWEAPDSLHDPDDPGLLFDETARNYAE